MNLKDSLFKRVMYSFGTSVKSKHLAALLTRSSKKKLWNLLRVEWAALRGRTHGFGYPYVLTVEPINACNLQCPLCPTGKGLAGRRRQTLPLHRFKDTINEVAEYVYVVNFQNWGEPMLARDLFEMVRHCGERRIFTCVATNGNYDTALNDAVIESRLDHISIAMDGTTDPTYSAYRIGGDLNLLRHNISDLMRKKRERDARKPFVELQFLVFDHNRAEIPDIQKEAQLLGVDGLLVRAGESPDNVRNLERFYTWNNRTGFCPRFWYTATLTSDGGLVPCCNFFEKKDDFGNAFDVSFVEVWFNDAFRQSRSAVARRDLERLNNVCKMCKIYNRNRPNYPIWNPARD